MVCTCLFIALLQSTPNLKAIKKRHPAIGNFITDVSPLAEVNYYIYAAVPQELIDSYKTCEIKVGFTENFDYKVIDVNDLPQFKMCDDIFTIVLP